MMSVVLRSHLSLFTIRKFYFLEIVLCVDIVHIHCNLVQHPCEHMEIESAKHSVVATLQVNGVCFIIVFLIFGISLIR